MKTRTKASLIISVAVLALAAGVFRILWGSAPNKAQADIGSHCQTTIYDKVNLIDESLNEEFLTAAENSQGEMVRVLLDKGADINAKDNAGETALWWAVFREDFVTAQYLIERGADVGAARTQENVTVLMMAAKQGNAELVLALLDKGADVNIEDWTGYSALVYAVGYGHTEVAKLMVKKGRWEDKKESFGRALAIAIVQEQNEIARLLIKEGADVNKKTQRYGFTTLMTAVDKGNIDIVRALVDNGADINARTTNGITALDIAKNRYPEIVSLLQQAGATNEVNANVGTKEVPVLNEAAARGYKEIVERQIAAGADVNARDKKFGGTALHWAAVGGHAEIAELLIAEGADVNAKIMDGSTALHLAAQENNKDVVEALIAAKADVNIRSNNGATALQAAAAKGCKEIVELLLAKGSKVNLKGKAGGTALHCAAAGGYTEIVKILIAAKLDINAKDDNGITALYAAEYNGHKETADLLRKHGAKK